MQNQINSYIETLQQKLGDKFQINSTAIEKEIKKSANNKSSLSIKILTVIGGIIATFAFIGFLLIAGIYKSDTVLLGLGIVFIVSALMLNKYVDLLITDTFSITLYLVGYTMLSYGLKMHEGQSFYLLYIYILIATISMLISQNYILVFISTLIICGSSIGLIFHHKAYDLFHVYNLILSAIILLWTMHEAKLIRTHKIVNKLYTPMRIALIISLIYGLFLVGKKGWIRDYAMHPWISSIVIAIGILYVVYQILQNLQIKNKNNVLLIMLFCLAICGLLIFAPAVLGSIFLMLLCFYSQNQSSLVLSLLALIYFICQYYYDMRYTLLDKSIIMLVSGALFLVLFYFIHKNKKENEQIH